MEKRTKGCKLLLAAAVLFALGGSFNFIGCSSDSDSGSPTSQNSEVETTIGAITISASAATANEDGTYSVVLTATPNADDTDATDITYVWSLGDDASNVTLGSSSSSTVTATISAKPASATVKVTASATGATSVSATYSLSVGYDYTIGALTITASDNDDGSKAISVSADSTATTASDVTIAITLAETVDGLTLTDNGDGTATITNANDTDTTATVVATATATGAASVTAQAEVTVAKAGTTYLYSIGKLTATVGNVSGNTRVVTVTAAETDNAPETITYAYSVDDEEFAVSESSNTTGSVTLTNNSTTTKAVTLTVTATADESTSNSTTANVTVPANETLTISGVTLSATSGSAEQGESVTVTVSGGTVTSSDTARDAELSGELPEVTYAWSTDYSGISFDDSTASEVTITAASTASTGTATITVTASADGAESVTATYTLTVTKAYAYTLFSQNFDDVTDATTVATSYFASSGLSIDDGALYFKTDNAGTTTGYAKNTGFRTAISEQLIIPSSGEYCLSFDALLNTAGGSNESMLSVGTTGSTSKSGNVVPTQYLFGLSATASSEWALNGTSTTVTLDTATFYHFKLTVNLDDSTAKVSITSDAGTVLEETAITPVDDDGYSPSYINMELGRYSGIMALDNIVLKSDTDVVVFSEAATISGDNSTIDASGTTTLTASAAAGYASGASVSSTTYAWSLADGDSDYVELSATEGTSVTLIGTNSTINDYTATVTLTVTADGTTSTAAKSITVSALQTLLSDVTISAADSATSVSAGDTLVLTTSGGATDGSVVDATISWAWTSADESIATVTAGTDDTSTATVKGLTAGSSTTITATATLGSITKSATYTVEVTESTATLSSITFGDTVTESDGVYTATVAAGFTTTITATTNDNIVPTWTWESSSTDKMTVTYTTDSYESTATLTGVSTGSATLTVTAVSGSVTLTKTITVTVAEPTKTYIYQQDFETGESDWTAITSDYDKCAADDITSKNKNTSKYIYAIGCRSGDTGTQVAASSSTDGTVVEFDLKFDGVYAGKSSSFALLGAKNSTNWLSSDYEILTFSAGSTIAGYINTFTINGTDYLTACSVSTDGSEWSKITGSTLARGSTGWLHVKATLDFTNHTMDLVVTKIATNATVCEATGLAFMDGTAASSLEYLYAAAGKTYGGVYMDNFEVYKYE